MNIEDSFFQKIQSFHEDEFSRSIVIPLFKRMGYDFCDFNGGAYEKGKDIIAIKKGEFGDLEIAAIQSKKIKTNKSSESRRLFSDITYQLRQCLQKKVPCSDGIERLPIKAFLITPFDVDTRHIEEQIEILQDPRICTIDKCKLSDAIKHHWPTAFKEILGDYWDATTPRENELINLELKNALAIPENTAYSRYYTDLNFFVGKAESRKLLRSIIRISSKKSFMCDQEKWENLKELDQELEKYIGQEIIENKKETENEFKKKEDQYNSKENRDNISSKKEIDKKTSIQLERLNSTITKISRSISNKYKDDKKNPTSTIISDILIKLRKLKPINHDLKKLGQIKDHPEHLADELRRESNAINSITILQSQSLKLGHKIIPKPEYNARLNSKRIETKLNEISKSIKSGIKNLNDKTLSTSEVGNLLREINNFLKAFDLIFRKSVTFSLKVGLEDLPKEIDTDTLSIPIHKIFDSGCDIAIFGHAGAGKTTTLHTYAKKYPMINQT